MLALSLLLLALCASSTLASTAIVSVDGLSFQAGVNVSVSAKEDRFNYRHTSFMEVPLLGALYTSVDAQVEQEGSSGTSSVDAIIGFCYAASIATFGADSPGAWMLYFSADANFDLSSVSINSDFSATASLVGNVFAKIEEISESGNVVETHTLKSRSWGKSGIQKSGPNDELKYLTFSSTKDSFDVRITYAVSAVLAKLNVGGATITPRTMESFVEIQGYPYGNPKNHLRLTLYAAHVSAKAAGTYSATQTVIAGSGKEQIYFHFASEAVVDGQNVAVTVNGLEKTELTPNDIDNNLFKGALTASGDLQAEIRVVTVDFPAGAVFVSYDPAMGFGAPDSAGFLLPSVGALLLSFVAAFFVLF